MAHSHQDPHDHTHDHHESHAHGPGGHVHTPASFGTAFAIGIGLNAAFVVLEAIFGIMSNSVALVADAGHNLSDVMGLLVAWGAMVLSKRAPTKRFTYGLKGSSILAALFNAIVLLITVGAIGWEAIQRLLHPEPVAGVTVMTVAAAGIVVNGISAWLFASGRKGDINIKGAFMHMAADAVISVGVVIAGFVILYTGWAWIDPVTSLVISAVIVIGTWSLLRDSTAMSLSAVPPSIDPSAVRSYLEKCTGVLQIHDLHIWPMSTTEVALTCHLVIPTGTPGDAYLMEISHKLKHAFGIQHATLQVETDPGTPCALAPDHVV